MAPAGFELATNGLGNRCSIHLSYGAIYCWTLHLTQSIHLSPDVIIIY
jgi:hypothetical protein